MSLEANSQVVETSCHHKFLAIGLTVVVPVEGFGQKQEETVAVLGNKPLLVMDLREQNHEREGTDKPLFEACGRTKAKLRPAARQERRQKHHTKQEPACFHGIKINIFSGCM